MRTLKIVGIGIASLVALVIAVLIAAALLIHPDAYRARIERTVQQSTGRSLQLSGELHLALFPSIALRFGPASLGNPPGFPATPFVTLREASLRVKLLPLLHGQLQVGHIDIDGLDAQLLRNAQGQGNWERPGSSSPGTAAAGAQHSAPASAPPALPEVAGLTLRNARVSYDGTVLAPLTLTIGRIAEGVAVPVSLQLQMQRPAAAPIDLSGSLALTYEPDALRVGAIDLHLDQSHLTGSLALTGAGSRAASFNLQIDRLDLDRYRSSSPTASAPPTTQPSAPLQLPGTMLESLQMQGSLLVGTLKLAGITLTQLQLQAMVQDGVAHLAPLAAQLYGGTFHGDVTLDARGTLPVMMTDQSLANVDLAHLLQDFDGTQRLSGRGNLSLMLRGQGGDSNALLRSLEGQVVLDVKQGAVQGIDLPFDVQEATALFEHQAPPAGQGSGRTSFETLHASAMVHDGVAETHDLDIATQLLTVRGQGTLNLVSDAVKSQLQVALLKAPASAGASSATLAEVPLDVTGTLSSLTVRPDLQQLARSQVQQQLQQQLKKRGIQLPPKVQGALQGLFGGARPR